MGLHENFLEVGNVSNMPEVAKSIVW